MLGNVPFDHITNRAWGDAIFLRKLRIGHLVGNVSGADVSNLVIRKLLRYSPLTLGIVRVVRRRAHKQVARVAASRVVAGVARKVAFGYLPLSHFKCVPMGADILAIPFRSSNLDNAIPARAGISLPWPARIWAATGIHIRPEPCLRTINRTLMHTLYPIRTTVTAGRLSTGGNTVINLLVEGSIWKVALAVLAALDRLAPTSAGKRAATAIRGISIARPFAVTVRSKRCFWQIAFASGATLGKLATWHFESSIDSRCRRAGGYSRSAPAFCVPSVYQNPYRYGLFNALETTP